MATIQADVVLVGGGIMSATLGMLIHQLDPKLHICMIEQLPSIAQESTEAMNNAGTGHAGYCELNYTPKGTDGRVSIQRALEINAAFEVSLQFWSHLVKSDQSLTPSDFINRVPHISAVWGEQDIAFLKQRFQLLKAHPLFAEMQWGDSESAFEAWMPLMMHGRTDASQMAATRIDHGSDVNFGAITKYMVSHLEKNAQFQLLSHTKVTGLKKQNNHWQIKAKNNDGTQSIVAPFVFLGAGGGALRLLQKSKIPEALGYGGFPVSGQWLVCKNPALVPQHHAKVYSLAAVGAPPMSVPHLDTRIIDGKASLMFGPYAGFTTKFLKNGSTLDLAKSVKTNNLKSLLGAGRHNIDLTKYLIKEVFQSQQQRLDSLRTFMPEAKKQDWTLAHAGKRVQVIKNCNQKWGKLEFGTEIVASQDGSLAALLGASPGASVSVQAMLDVLGRFFPSQMEKPEWKDRLKTMIPSYGESLIEDASLLSKVRSQTLSTLKLSN